MEASFGIDGGEPVKSVDTATGICRWLNAQGATRDDVTVVMGGGSTTDVAGFAASVYKRGMRTVNIPTTLLAQVDAAIGGKTAADLDGLKNSIGSFHRPMRTVLRTDFLRTLPRNQVLSGLAEMLKTFLVSSPSLYRRTVKLFSVILSTDAAAPLLNLDSERERELGRLIKRAAGIKKGIVFLDPEDRGLRTILNFGHTFGHAIEWKQSDSGGELTHGEAVAAGMIESARISAEKGIAGKSVADELCRDFASLGLPTALPYSRKDLAQALKNDKKCTSDGRIRFVMIRRPGRVCIKKIKL